MALAKATDFSHLQTTMILMEAGADPTESYENGSYEEQGPLITVSCGGHEEMVRFLSTDARTHLADNDSKAFLEAMQAGHIDVARLLLGHEAPPQLTTRFAHPSVWCNTAMRHAAADPNHDGLHMLLADPRLGEQDIEVAEMLSFYEGRMYSLGVPAAVDVNVEEQVEELVTSQQCKKQKVNNAQTEIQDKDLTSTQQNCENGADFDEEAKAAFRSR
ncbi:hypothetical protein HDU80_009605 [Chytriomyces hyalinus]|nr:hypothetical protein HDU80_009605 [Chytriomyces hyalinus]